MVQALLTAARAEKSTTVQRSYAQAAATVCKYASEARAAKLVEEAVDLYTTPGEFSQRFFCCCCYVVAADDAVAVAAAAAAAVNVTVVAGAAAAAVAAAAAAVAVSAQAQLA